MSIGIVQLEKQARLREQFRAAMLTQPDFCLVCEFADSGTLPEGGDLHPDVICIGNSHSRALKRFMQQFPQARIVRYFRDTRQRPINDAIRAGVCGYILEAEISAEIVSAIRAVNAGGHYSSSCISSLVINSYKRLIIGKPIKNENA